MLRVNITSYFHFGARLTLDALDIGAGGKTAALKSSGTAAIDSGTNLIQGTNDDVAAFWATVDGATELGFPNEGFYSYPCSAKLGVTITFGGKEWAISDDDINLGPVNTGSSQCVGAVVGPGSFDVTFGEPYPAWIIGDTFLVCLLALLRSCLWFL
jgi:cathepsin D